MQIEKKDIERKKAILCGAGKRGISALKYLKKKNVLCFVDNNKELYGKQISNVPVMSFDEIRKIMSRYPECYIIVTPKGDYGVEIETQLLKLKVDTFYKLENINGYTQFTMKSVNAYIWNTWLGKKLLDITNMRKLKKEFNNVKLKKIYMKDINFYRDTFCSVQNKQLVEHIIINDQKWVSNFLHGFYNSSENEILFDEHYSVRQGLRIVYEYIVHEYPNDIKICDAACGNGELIIRLAKKGYSTFALDMSKVRVNKVKRFGVGIRQENLENSSFKNDMFDVVICMEALEHVQDLEKAIKTIFRMLKKGGKAIITVPYQDMCESNQHVRCFDESKLNGIFEIMGFHVNCIMRIGYLNHEKGNSIFMIATKGE